MCPRGRPRGQGRPRGLHLCLYSPRHSTTQSQQCIKGQEVKTENNIPLKI